MHLYLLPGKLSLDFVGFGTLKRKKKIELNKIQIQMFTSSTNLKCGDV